MSRRRISSARRKSRLRRSSGGPGELEEDSNVFERDDPLWYKRVEGHNTVLRPSLQLSIAEESSEILDSGSDVDMHPPQHGWWNPLRKFNQTINQTSKVRRTIRSSVNADHITGDITLHEDSLDSLPGKDPRKRKTRLFFGSKKRESLGSTAFLKLLNESATTAISEPGPSMRRKSIPITPFLSDEDSLKRTKNSSTSKSRPRLFTEIRTTESKSTSNVFNDLLENISSNSESSVPAVNENQQARSSDELQETKVQNAREIEPIQDTVRQERQSTLGSDFSDVELQKKRLGVMRPTRNSIERKAFNGILTSQEESIQMNPQNIPQEVFHKISDTSFGISKQTYQVLNSEGEDLFSLESQLVHESYQNKSLRTSKEHSLSLDKSRGTSQNLDISRRSSRLSESIKVPDRLSIFGEQPQYESTRKIDILKLRSRRSKELIREELRTGDANSVEVSDPEHIISTQENMKESRNCSSNSASKNNVKRSKESSGDFADTQNRSREKEQSVDSQSSCTISLSEGGSIQSEVPSENMPPLDDTSQSNNQHIKTSSSKRYKTSFLPSDVNSDEEKLEENSLPKEKAAKPIIIDYEILKANDLDIRQLKSVKTICKENNATLISRSPSAIGDISASKSIEIPSIFPKFSQISRKHFTGDFDNNRGSGTLNNKSSSDSRKDGNEDDNKSEVGENPLLIYSENFGEEVQESEYEETSPAEDFQRKVPEKDHREKKQKMINDYFKRRGEEKTEKRSQSQRIPFAKAADNKKLMADHKKQLEAIVAPLKNKYKKEFFKRPKVPEPPKKKSFISKGTSKKKQSKFVDPAYLVNGVLYKPPKLPRPKRWATDHLYKFIWKKIEPTYGGRKRVRSEKFILRLTEVFNKVQSVKLYKNYVEDLESLIEEMARLRLIVNRKDFNDFCHEFMPYQFRVKATPILLPGNIMSIPYDRETFYAPILRGSWN